MRSADQLDIRPVTEDEFPDWARAIERAFGEEIADDKIERFRRYWGDDLSRTMAAFDGDRIVGTNGEWAFDMTVPEGDPVGCAGVTVVSVTHDWRRRGVLSRMMSEQLRRIHDRGTEPFAALYASESPIYGRFGYGTGAPHAHYRIDRSWASFRDPIDVSEIRLIGAEEAIERFPAIYERARVQRGGMMSHSELRWREWLSHDVPDERDGYSPRFHAELPGRGYAIYRVKPDWDERGAKGKLLVIKLIGVDPDAEAAMWQFVFGVDLVSEIQAHMQPVDGPLPLRLAYRGRLEERLREGLWLRLVEVRAALASRRYHEDGRLVFEVHDRLCAWNEGRWALEADGGRASCERTEDEPDLVLDVADLAALGLGGQTPHQLAWAGRIEERRDGALSQARRMFAVDIAPWNPFEF